MTSRRDFLKATAVAGAGIAMNGLSGLAEPRAIQDLKPATTRLPGDTESSMAEFTRGIGIYPGEPSADFGPILEADTSGTYRNLALLRPAFHSSSYDYNLTAQLVTDGMKDDRLPRWVVVSEPFRGPIAKPDREVVLDHAPMNTLEILGSPAHVDIEIAGGDPVPEIDRIQLFVV